MYIPIGPSKKQLYKIILLLLCLLFGFKSCVKANTIGNITTRLNINGSGIVVDTNSSISINQQSIVTGSLLSYPMGNGIDMLNGVALIDDNIGSAYMCNVGTSLLYNDSTAQIILMSFECNVPKQSGPYPYRIGYSKGTNGVVTGITTSGYVNVVPVSDTGGGGGSGIDYTNNFSDLYYTLQDIKNRDSTFYHDIYVLIENKLNAILQALQNNQTSITNIQQNTQQINDAINSDNVDNNQANSFFSDFNSNTPQGLISLINKPLDFLNGLYNTCSPIEVYVPYFDFDLTLPCISSIHNGIFDTIIPIAKIIINGLICYRLVLGFINIINKLKDPNDSDIEVVDL